MASRNMALRIEDRGPVPLAVSRTARTTKRAAAQGAMRPTTKELTNAETPCSMLASHGVPIADPGGKNTGTPRNWNQVSVGSRPRKITARSIHFEKPPLSRQRKAAGVNAAVHQLLPASDRVEPDLLRMKIGDSIR